MSGKTAKVRCTEKQQTILEKIEYEYTRHGTLCLIGNWDVGA
ncbi:MAG: hypothetical protein ACQESR_07235 [Planctomycetota bacterium]